MNTQHDVDMEVFYSNGHNSEDSRNITGKDLENLVKQLDSGYISYFRLEIAGGDYMQCTGSNNQFTVELRVFANKSFKHYVIGKHPQSKVWQMIYCAVGPIRVLSHEVINMAEVEHLTRCFILNVEIPAQFIKRNISKIFAERNQERNEKN